MLPALVLLLHATTAAPSVTVDPKHPSFSVATTNADAKTAIKRGVDGALGGIRGCYVEALAKHPGMHGTVVVVFTVLPDGSASRPVISDDSMHNEDVEACVAKRLGAATFTLQDQTVRVVLPLQFRTGNEPPAKPGATPELSPEAAADDTIAKIRPAIVACWKHAAGKDPGLSGVMSVRFTIEDDGTVRATEIARSTLHDVEVEGCVAKVLRDTKFAPPSGGRFSLTRTFAFPPEDELPKR